MATIFNTVIGLPVDVPDEHVAQYLADPRYQPIAGADPGEAPVEESVAEESAAEPVAEEAPVEGA